MPRCVRQMAGYLRLSIISTSLPISASSCKAIEAKFYQNFQPATARSISSFNIADNARTQAAQYARQLDISQIWLIMFIDYVDDDNRRKYEVDYVDKNVTGQPVTVSPRFIATGK